MSFISQTSNFIDQRNIKPFFLKLTFNKNSIQYNYVDNIVEQDNLRDLKTAAINELEKK